MLPIYAAEPHTVKYLRSIGYDLYDDLLNHDYDKDENDVSRLENVVLECKRLLNKQEEICDFITNNWDRIESNNRHLKNCKYRGGVI
jgi:ribosomal protein S17E